MDKNNKVCCGLCDSLDKNDKKHTFSAPSEEVYKCKKYADYVSIDNKICPPQLCDFIDLKDVLK